MRINDGTSFWKPSYGMVSSMRSIRANATWGKTDTRLASRSGSVSENEDWYDRELAPKLLELANACHERGISFLAVTEYEPGSRAQTRRLTDTAGLEMIMIQHCANTAPNVDGYAIGLIRYCREKGIDMSASIILGQFTG